MRRLVLLPALLAFLVVGAPPALAWTWPVDGPVLQPFLLGGDPYASGQHRGIDVGSADGTPVLAPASGTVTFAGTVPGGGRSITIQTPDGFAVTLLHLGEILVAEGVAIAEGERVGVSGRSGAQEHPAPSIHLGVRIAAEDAGYLDPLALLPPRVTPSVPVADEQPDESGAPPVESEDGAVPAPAVEVTTLPPEPEAAVVAPASLPEGAQQVVAEPVEAEVAPLEPLTVVSVGSTESPGPGPPSESAEAAAHAASVTGTAEAASTAPAASPGDTTRPVDAEAPSSAGVPMTRSDAHRGEQQPRAERIGRSARPHGVRIDRRVEPFVEPGPTATRTGAGSVERGDRRQPRSVQEPEQVTVPGPAPGGGAWLRYGAVGSLLAALAAVLALLRYGRGGRRTGRGELPPPAPPLGAAQGAGPGLRVPPVLPVIERDPRPAAPRPGRRLDRGGPGTPVNRPAAGVRGRRASV